MTNACVFIAVWMAVAVDTPVTARAALDEANIPFHRVAHYRVIVEGQSDVEPVVQPWRESLPGLTVDADAPVESMLPDGRKRLEQVFTLTPSMVTQYTLPVTVVLDRGRKITELAPQTLAVRALTAEELAAVSAPLELITLKELENRDSSTWLRLTVLVAVAAVAIALAGIMVSWFLRRRKAPAPLTPLETARIGLDALERELDSEALSCEAFMVALSGVLRAYLCTSFDPAVAGQSTPEFLEATLPSLPLDPVHTRAVRDLFGVFDRAKFGQFVPDREGQTRNLHAVRNLIAALEEASTRRAEAALRGAA